MNKTQTLLNQYVADLQVMNTKLHNLHWNVTGKRFKVTHEYLEALYDDLFEKFDEVAERIKMLGGFPDASLKAYLDATEIEELPSEDVTSEKAFELVKTDYAYLKKLATDARNTADESGDFGTVGLLEDHVADYDKELYFITQTLK